MLDVTVRRNGYGRQRESFEADLDGARPRRRSASPACSSARPWSSGSARRSRCSPSTTACRCSAARARSSSLRSIPSCRGDLRLHELFPARGELMSGHSKWHSIKHKKGAADAKRGKLFAVLIRQIEVAARAGRRRSRVERDAAHDGAEGARQLGADRHDPARDQAGHRRGRRRHLRGRSSYEGYAPGGVAVIVQASPTTATARRPRSRTSSAATAARSPSRARCRGSSSARASSCVDKARPTRTTSCSPRPTRAPRTSRTSATRGRSRRRRPSCTRCAPRSRTPASR